MRVRPVTGVFLPISPLLQPIKSRLGVVELTFAQKQYGLVFQRVEVGRIVIERLVDVFETKPWVFFALRERPEKNADASGMSLQIIGALSQHRLIFKQAVLKLAEFR